MFKRSLATAALSVSLLLAGCSHDTTKAQPQVATLQSGTPSTATAGQTAPVIRPDTTAEEEARMAQPWMKCLQKHGVPVNTGPDGLLSIGGSGNTQATNGRLQADTDPKITAACSQLKPVLAPELDEDKNPYWADDNEDYNKCRVARGEPLIKQNGKWVPGPGWNNWTPDPDMELACQAESFDGKKG